jgi:hypothetical protein
MSNHCALYQEINVITDLLVSAQLDLDDDIFIAIDSNDCNLRMVTLWEMYRIGRDYPIEILEFGSWSESKRLQVSTVDKWYRRGDLKVFLKSLAN